MTNEEKWRQEFESACESLIAPGNGWSAYLAACTARHAEVEALRAENTQLRRALESAKQGLYFARALTQQWGYRGDDLNGHRTIRSLSEALEERLKGDLLAITNVADAISAAQAALDGGEATT